MTTEPTATSAEPGSAYDRQRQRVPNRLLRAARLRTPSPTDPDRPTSRRELAEAVNAYVFETTGRTYALDAHYVGRLERGLRRWPNADYRAGFRAVLGAGSDAELGFRQPRRGEDGENRAVEKPEAARGAIETVEFVEAVDRSRALEELS